jgi:hypothetical protein
MRGVPTVSIFGTTNSASAQFAEWDFHSEVSRLGVGVLYNTDQ